MKDLHKKIDSNDAENNVYKAGILKRYVKLNSRRIRLLLNYSVIAIAPFTCSAFVFDIISPLGIETKILYFIPIFLTLRIPKNQIVFISAIICSMLLEISFYLSNVEVSNTVAVSNRALDLITIWVSAILVLNEKKHRLVASHLSSIVAGSNDAIISVDIEGKINSWNDAAEQLYGYTETEVKGKHVDILNHNHNDIASSFESLKKEIKISGIIKNYEVRRTNKNGTSRFVSMYIGNQRFKRQYSWLFAN